MKKQRFKKYLALVIVGCTLSNILFAGCSKKDGSAADTITAENAQEAAAKLGEKAEEFGYENALSELTEKSTTVVDGDSYYRLQQNYQGIPVYGRTVVCATDEEGIMSLLTGNVADVINEVDLTPTIDASQATETMCTFLADEYGYEVSEMKIDPLSENDLCIFIETDSAEVHLAYCIYWGAYEFLVDAHSSAVIQCLTTVYTDMVEVSLGDYTPELNLQKDDEENSYYTMVDETRHIRIYDANNGALSYEFYNPQGEIIKDREGNYYKENECPVEEMSVTLLSTNDISQPISYADPPTFDERSVRLLSNVQTTYDFYQEVLLLDSISLEGTPVWVNAVYDDNMEYINTTPSNAYSWAYASLLLKDTVISFGTRNSIDLDIVAHEYTHAIERRRSNMIYAGESGAIMEALSDIYGEMVEEWSAGRDSDWIHNDRNLKKPTNSFKPKIYQGMFWENTSSPNENNDWGGVHNNSTVISHAAYLMSESGGGLLDTDDLAKLWYRAMLMMPSDCDFATCRKLVEWAAVSVGSLTDAQRKCISEAFDRVGIKKEELSEEILIDCDKNVAPGSTLAVYNVDGELHPHYTLNISGTIAEHKQAYSSSVLIDIGYGRYEETREIETPIEEPLKLRDGYYTFTITDENNPQFEYVFTVSVSDKGTDNKIELYTEFEDRLLVIIEPEPKKEVAIVTDAYSDTLMDDQYDMLRCYHIPQFNLPGDIAAAFNAEIYDELYALLQRDVYDVYDKYGYVSTGKMNYGWGQKGNIASVIVETDWVDVSFSEYRIYNVNTETGKEASRAELLAAFGLTEESFKAQAKEMLKSKFETVNNWAIESVGKTEYNKKLNSTISDENIKNAQLYINEEGQLCLMVSFYGFAGPERTNSCLSLETGDWQYVPECADHN